MTSLHNDYLSIRLFYLSLPFDMIGIFAFYEDTPQGSQAGPGMEFKDSNL